MLLGQPQGAAEHAAAADMVEPCALVDVDRRVATHQHVGTGAVVSKFPRAFDRGEQAIFVEDELEERREWQIAHVHGPCAGIVVDLMELVGEDEARTATKHAVTAQQQRAVGDSQLMHPRHGDV